MLLIYGVMAQPKKTFLEILIFEKNKSNNLQKEFEFTFQQQEKAIENICIKVKDLELKLREKENSTIKEDLESEISKCFIEKLFKIK